MVRFDIQPVMFQSWFAPVSFLQGKAESCLPLVPFFQDDLGKSTASTTSLDYLGRQCAVFVSTARREVSATPVRILYFFIERCSFSSLCYFDHLWFHS